MIIYKKQSKKNSIALDSLVKLIIVSLKLIDLMVNNFFPYKVLWPATVDVLFLLAE